MKVKEERDDIRNGKSAEMTGEINFDKLKVRLEYPRSYLGIGYCKRFRYDPREFDCLVLFF